MNRVNLILNNKIFLENYKVIEKYEKNREYCRHNLNHFLAVARLMYIKNLEENLDLNKDIIYATALLHDIGRSLQYSCNIDHIIASKEISLNILKECDFSNIEIEMIVDAIIAHHSIDDIVLNKLLRFADKLSRNCFFCKMREKCNWSEEKQNKGVQL